MATLNYERRGSGTPLVLLHGIGSHWQVWSPVIDQLAADHDVIAVDLPGYGSSVPLSAGTQPGISAIADALENFFDGIGLTSAHLVGNSLGGWLALELAKRGRALSVTALSPGGFFEARGGRIYPVVLEGLGTAGPRSWREGRPNRFHGCGTDAAAVATRSKASQDAGRCYRILAARVGRRSLIQYRPGHHQPRSVLRRRADRSARHHCLGPA